MSLPGVEVASPVWTDHVDPGHGYALSHPVEWEVTPGVSGLLVSLTAVNDVDASFRPNMNVVRRVQDRMLDLNGLAESVLSALARLLTDLLVIDVDTAVVAERPARRILVAYRQGIYALTSEQWVFVSDDHVWTISAGATAQRWGRLADTFDEIVRSFRMDPA